VEKGCDRASHFDGLVLPIDNVHRLIAIVSWLCLSTWRNLPTALIEYVMGFKM
jgi:hypothetical protein